MPVGTRTGATGATGGTATTAEVTLRPGRPDEAAALSALALRSKGHWGYDAAFLQACRAELTLDTAQTGQATVAMIGGERAGFVLLTDWLGGDRGAGVGELAMLFVDPPHIGQGLGRLLLAAAAEEAALRGWSRLRIESDPGAEPFYVAAGARRVGSVASGSLPGRRIPLLELEVDVVERTPSTTSRSRRRSS